jgi:hypothetical protein
MCVSNEQAEIADSEQEERRRREVYHQFRTDAIVSHHNLPAAHIPNAVGQGHRVSSNEQAEQAYTETHRELSGRKHNLRTRVTELQHPMVSQAPHLLNAARQGHGVSRGS